MRVSASSCLEVRLSDEETGMDTGMGSPAARRSAFIKLIRPATTGHLSFEEGMERCRDLRGDGSLDEGSLDDRI